MSKNLGIGKYDAITSPGEYAFRKCAGFYDEFVMYCPKFKTCSIKIHTGAPDATQALWHFNGDYGSPTIAPSIGCDLHPRCGQHTVVQNGEIIQS